MQSLVTAWRIFFFANVVLEMFLLVWCFHHLWRMAKSSTGEIHKRFFWFVCATGYMRLGIVTAVILRMYSDMPTFYLKIVHMFIVTTGILGYSRKLARYLCSRGKKKDTGALRARQCSDQECGQGNSKRRKRSPQFR